MEKKTSRLVAVVANIDENEKIFCEQVLGFVSADIPDVVDVACFPVIPDKDKYYVVFGDKARKLCGEILKNMNYVVIAEPSRLKKENGDEEARVAAWNELKRITQSIEQEIPLQEEEAKLSLNDLQPWLASQVEQFVRNMEIKDIKEWEGKTKDGRDIIFSADPVATSKINITFSELVMLKILQDTLGIKEVTISGNQRSNS